MLQSLFNDVLEEGAFLFELYYPPPEENVDFPEEKYFFEDGDLNW